MQFCASCTIQHPLTKWMNMHPFQHSRKCWTPLHTTLSLSKTCRVWTIISDMIYAFIASQRTIMACWNSYHVPFYPHHRNARHTRHRNTTTNHSVCHTDSAYLGVWVNQTVHLVWEDLCEACRNTKQCDHLQWWHHKQKTNMPWHTLTDYSTFLLPHCQQTRQMEMYGGRMQPNPTQVLQHCSQSLW